MTDILAFPQGNEWMDAEGNMRLIHEGGMTLRDYFAAAALQGLIAHGGNDSAHSYLQASHAYNIADAMMAERITRDA